MTLLAAIFLGMQTLPREAAADPAAPTYEQLELSYRTQPSGELAVRLLQAGSRDPRPGVRLWSARHGRKWLRDAALADDHEVQARAAIVVAEHDLGQIQFRGTYLDVVRVDGETLEPTALKEPWPVLPGPHLVTLGALDTHVSVSAGLVAYVDAPGSTMVQPVGRWTTAGRRWPEAKLATEAALVVCAATGVVAGGAYGYAQVDEPEDGGDASQRALVITAVAVGSVCLVGAVLVPLLWRGSPPARARASSRLQLTPVSMQLTF